MNIFTYFVKYILIIFTFAQIPVFIILMYVQISATVCYLTKEIINNAYNELNNIEMFPNIQLLTSDIPSIDV